MLNVEGQGNQDFAAEIVSPIPSRLLVETSSDVSPSLSLRRFANRLGDTLDNVAQRLFPSFQPELSLAGSTGEINTSKVENRQTSPELEQNVLAYQRLPGERREKGQYPFPLNTPTSPQSFGENSPTFQIPTNPLWRRKDRTKEPDVYPMRIIDAPVWMVEAIAGRVETRARNVAEHPYAFKFFSGIPNFPRLKHALKQEAEEVLSHNREVFFRGFVRKAVTFIEHRVIHTLAVALASTASAVPVLGRGISAGVSAYRGAPEEVILNAAMFVADLGFGAAILFTSPIPPLAIGIGAVDVLFNMYVNSSAARRYKEVNNKIIPKAYNILSFRRNPFPDDRRRVYANAFQSVRHNKPKLLSRLEDKESNLNPRDFTNQERGPKKMRENYAYEENKLRTIGNLLDALELMQFTDERSQRWWQFGKRFMRFRRSTDIWELKHMFGNLDDKMYKKWDFPHHEAERLLDWQTLLQQPSRP